jgi:hypothetical protein
MTLDVRCIVRAASIACNVIPCFAINKSINAIDYLRNEYNHGPYEIPSISRDTPSSMTYFGYYHHHNHLIMLMIILNIG